MTRSTDSVDIIIVGLPDTAVQESKERVRAAVPVPLCSGRKVVAFDFVGPASYT